MGRSVRVGRATSLSLRGCFWGLVLDNLRRPFIVKIVGRYRRLAGPVSRRMEFLEEVRVCARVRTQIIRLLLYRVIELTAVAVYLSTMLVIVGRKDR